MAQESIAAAGDTGVPAYLALIKLGYSVDRIDKDGEERWIAKQGALQLMADCPLEFLGLSLLRSERGPRWQASNSEIAEFLCDDFLGDVHFPPAIHSANKSYQMLGSYLRI